MDALTHAAQKYGPANPNVFKFVNRCSTLAAFQKLSGSKTENKMSTGRLDCTVRQRTLKSGLFLLFYAVCVFSGDKFETYFSRNVILFQTTFRSLTRKLV